MKIYILDAKDSFLTIADESKAGIFSKGFFGKSMKDSWEDILLEELKPRSKKYDISMFSRSPIFSGKSMLALEDLLKGKVEILPYQHRSENYYGINVLNVVDCIDLSKSDYTLRSGSSYVREINKYVFHEKMVMNETLFKIPQFVATRIYVTDAFRDKVLEAKLSGFEFQKVWDSAESSVNIEAVSESISFQGKAYTYEEAVPMVELGKTLASDKWLMQQENETLYIRYKELNGTYTWFDPIVIPPILLDLQWYIVSKVKYPQD